MATTKRVYPQLPLIGDRAAQTSLRLLWDRVYGVEEARAADAVTITSQAATIATLQTRLATAERTIAGLQLQSRARTGGGSGGGDLTDPPISGEVPGTSTQTFGGIGAATIYASPVVESWTEVGTLAGSFSPGLLSLSISSLAAWSAIPINIGGADQAATIWLFLQISGAWVGAGAERLRPNQTTKVENTLYSRWPGDWFYSSPFGPLTGIVPTAGQAAAFMVTAGSTRLDNRTNVQERTPVVQFSWPADGASAPF